MKASDLFVKCLENEGVEYIWGVPGEENLDLLESIRASSIKFITTRHEQAAGFMAATYGRLTGKTGVCLSTLGPGATNFITAAAYANLGGMPMLMITGQKPIKNSKQGHFQVVDTVEIMEPVTKFARQIVNAKRISSIIREAFRIAEEERPGAVNIELPEDIAREDVEDIPFEKQKVRRPSADEKSINMAIEMIEQSKMPLILIGAGANRKLVSNQLTNFIEKTGIPFFTTQMGKGVIDERHELNLGTAALSANDFIHCSIDRADLIINIGHDVIEKPPFIMEKGSHKKVIHVNFYGASVDDIYFPQLEVLGDISHTLWALTEKIRVQPGWNFDYFLKIKAEFDQYINSQKMLSGFPIKPQKLIAAVRNVVPESGIVSLDNGMYKLWFARNYKTYGPNTLLLDNALATMGAGLPASIAAKIVDPARSVLAVLGDGGFMMNSQEIETAVRLRLDLPIIIINDKSYGMIKWKQESMNFDNFALDFNNPDFVKYAESYGAKGLRVESEGELEEKLNELMTSKGVTLLEIPVDYSENTKVFTNELKNITCKL